jgi:hypothetical protein
MLIADPERGGVSWELISRWVPQNGSTLSLPNGSLGWTAADAAAHRYAGAPTLPAIEAGIGLQFREASATGRIDSLQTDAGWPPATVRKSLALYDSEGERPDRSDHGRR